MQEAIPDGRLDDEPRLANSYGIDAKTKGFEGRVSDSIQTINGENLEHTTEDRGRCGFGTKGKKFRYIFKPMGD